PEALVAALERAGATGDARERAVQAVVRLAGEVRDPIRMRLLLERASQVFGLAEAVLSRAVALGRRGESVAAPVEAAVREQRRGESDLERALLRALLHAPEALEPVRAMVGPEDFRDAACGALARWLWSGRLELPDEGDEGALARELVAGADDTAGAFDWAAEAIGAARRMVERRLKWQLREHRNQLGRAGEGSESTRLIQEIDAIARSLRELSTQS
ncbi:MAG: hypothetical protein ACRENJ_09480, partial [Candidatus Eiseniibacteriota bacterium]